MKKLFIILVVIFLIFNYLNNTQTNKKLENFEKSSESNAQLYNSLSRDKYQDEQVYNPFYNYPVSTDNYPMYNATNPFYNFFNSPYSYTHY
jgi:sortase (surface protein transpeptidase)